MLTPAQCQLHETEKGIWAINSPGPLGGLLPAPLSALDPVAKQLPSQASKLEIIASPQLAYLPRPKLLTHVTRAPASSWLTFQTELHWVPYVFARNAFNSSNVPSYATYTLPFARTSFSPPWAKSLTAQGEEAGPKSPVAKRKLALPLRACVRLSASMSPSGQEA